MSTVPWQLVAVEDAELSTINLKLGATLLGRGQRATPGLDDDSISRIAARIQVDPRRIQFTSMAHPGFLRITSADSGVAKKLVRGQAVLLAMGDMIDLACSTELCAPASRFTYMLAEHIPDSDIQDELVSGNTSNCKPANSYPAPLQEAQAFSVQQTGDKPANIAQLAATPVASAASPPLGRSPDQFPMQDALETQAYAQLPAVDANHIPASAALPAADQAPMYQAVSPQAGTQTSSPQKSPHTIPVYQAEVADPCLGVQNQGCPELVVATSSSMPSMPGVPGEATLALADPSTCNAQLPGTTSAASAQQGGKLPPGLPMQTEDHMPDLGENSNDSRKSADHQTAVGNLSNPSPANDQPQFEPTPVAAAAAAAAGTVETEPGMLAAQTDFLVKAEPESDTSMEDANKRSAADVFEETVMQCKKVVSEASSILLNRESEGAGGGRTSRIAASERATMWHNELQGLLKRCKMPQLYIGVLGDTGAGKSSTINCLLGEENVLPVNGMRACTACVVEISHIPSNMYEGTVECMTRGEWTAQATSLWNDLIDERGRLKICMDADRRLNTGSIEGAAQATLETVYGPRNLRRSGMTLEKLLEVNNKITGLLGRTINIREHAVKAFRKRIGEYVDSHNKKDEIQAWPLVKVCKLRHNWQVLSTGAVVVDLPGVRDANAARGAVAEKYMKSCNAVWIVADITRAVDNRTAKDLLGENFRRQMLMDGQYGSITFICTKTDVIQVSETVRSFSQGGNGRVKLCEAAGVPLEQYEAAQQRVDERQSEFNKHEAVIRRCKKKAKPLVRALVGLRKRLKNCRAKIQGLEASASGAGPDQRAHSGSESDSDFESGDESADSGAEYAAGDKRKSSRANSGHSKRRRQSSAMSDDESDSDLELGMSSDEGSDASSEGEEEVALPAMPKKGSGPSTLPELQAYVEELQAAIEDKSAIVKTLKSEQRDAETQSNKVLRKLTQVQLAVTEICGRARNSYSKGVLKKDFRDGLLEMEETAADVERDAGGPQLNAGRPGGSGQQRRKAQAEESELPVFCVSAKDCQRIEGRTSKDGFPSAFTKIEYTEMPQLRKHVHHVTEQGRLHAARSLASGLAQFIKTTAATLVHHGTINAELQGACHAAFKIELGKLKSAAKQLLAAWKQGLEHDCTQGGISPRLNLGADAARNRAVATQAKWGAHKRDGGLYWATYKATVRPARNGVYKSTSAGEINFNADLARPILDGISMEWEALFGSTVVNRLKEYKKGLVKHVSTFLAAVKASLVKLGVDENRLHRIVEEVQAQEVRKCTDMLAQIAQDIQTRQRDMSRDVIEPTVQDTMTEPYAACCAEAGPGQFERMRRLMKSAVERHKSSMFAEAARKLEGAMKDLVATVAKGLDKAQQTLAARVAQTFAILWERPSCSILERRAALANLQGLAAQMQPICRDAGAEVLELSLPEEEDQQQEQADLIPSRHAKQARVKAEPKEEARVKAEPEEEDALMKEDEEDSDESMDDSESNSDLDSEDDEEEEEEEEEEGEQGSDAGDDVDEVAGQNQVEAWKARYVSMSNPYNDIEEDEDGEGDQLDGQYETRVNDGFEMDAYNEFEEGGEDEGDEDEELDNDEVGTEEVPKESGGDQFGHMVGSGSAAMRARHIGLAGKDPFRAAMPLRAPTPPFGTPLRLVKPEPTDDPTGPSKAEASIKLMHDLFASHAHSTNPVASRSSAALPKSAGFKSTAQHMRHRGEGARHSTGSMIPLTSLLGAGHTPLPSTSGLPFSVPRPPREPFAGTVFDPAPTEAIQAQAADQASTGKAAVSEPKPEGAAGGAVAADSGVASGSPGGVTEVQQAATVAAEEDLHAAEHFAAGALQAPQGLVSIDVTKRQEVSAAEAFLKQGLAADMVQADSADAVSKARTNPDSAAASTSGVDATIAKAAAEGGTLQEARLKSSEAKTCTRAGAEVSVLEASTPAGSASGVKEASTAQKPGSQTWFKKAGGILGRWTVPVKVKKEPKSKHLGMTDLIDLT